MKAAVKGRGYRLRKDCRLCGSRALRLILDMGWMPLAGEFPLARQVGREKRYPLRIFLCDRCLLVQVLDVVSPKILFRDYRYLSSVTSTLRGHFESLAGEYARRSRAVADPFVVEIGSNDGVLLGPLKARGIRSLGVDPAANVVRLAEERGLAVENAFFDERTAARILERDGPASIITGSNVLAHIDDMESVLRGARRLLRPGGVFVMEVHYLPDLIRDLQYDFFYHEHLCYYSLRALIPFLARHGLHVFDAVRFPIHSGSIRIYSRKSDRPVVGTGRLRALLTLERRMRLGEVATYTRFAQKVQRHASRLRAELVALKSKGARIVGYGAPGRGNTLLNFCRIGVKELDYIVDASPNRHGRFTPGTHVRIDPPGAMRKDPPDVALLLAWPYEKEVLSKEGWFLEGGGRFLVPLPELRWIARPRK